MALDSAVVSGGTIAIGDLGRDPVVTSPGTERPYDGPIGTSAKIAPPWRLFIRIEPGSL